MFILQVHEPTISLGHLGHNISNSVFEISL